MGACARNMESDSAEIKPGQCCIKLVFHFSYIMMHGNTKLKFKVKTYLLFATTQFSCISIKFLHVTAGYLRGPQLSWWAKSPSTSQKIHGIIGTKVFAFTWAYHLSLSLAGWIRSTRFLAGFWKCILICFHLYQDLQSCHFLQVFQRNTLMHVFFFCRRLQHENVVFYWLVCRPWDLSSFGILHSVYW